MTLIRPPGVPIIVEPAIAPSIVTNDVAIEFRPDGVVWVHCISRHCHQEFRREAVLCFTGPDFRRARDWVVSLGDGPTPTSGEHNIIRLRANH